MSWTSSACYIKARAEAKAAAILCGTWEMADAINQRLHDHFTSLGAPSVHVARDQQVRGNRWRVIGVDPQRGRIAAERLTDFARVIFEGNYLREHITLGYASTVHSAQGMTIGNHNQHGICW